MFIKLLIYYIKILLFLRILEIFLLCTIFFQVIFKFVN